MSYNRVSYKNDTYLVVLNDSGIVAVLAVYNTFHVQSHFLQFAGESLKTIDLLDNEFAQMTLRGVLNISQKVLNTNFFLDGSFNRGWHVNELTRNVSFVINLFFGEVSLGWQLDLFLILNSDDNKGWLTVVFSQHLVDINIILPDGRAGRVPANNLLATVDPSHHVVHLLMENVIEEPNISWVLLILFEWNRIAISHM